MSKTFWVQVAAVVSMAVPAVRVWMAANPVEFVAALAAVNVLVRFVTSGAISFLGDDKGGNAGGPTGPSAVVAVLAVAGVMSLLPSCQGSGYGVDGRVTYRFGEDGAKAGLAFAPGGGTEGFVRYPLRDAETGEVLGWAGLGVGRVEEDGK